ncbi:tubulin-tyrosine ligase family protein, putative [Ichthyophthirius multifiliis]|uniref:Tubulin-tyrosine ligase family protein, putative n=1 Tax=Ichthyophthirius multifiliis TaxID=5932 RepID=G0R5V3_ICHMU|nr:tubulin-tyrosine ligase family protein, putative [Ichthyophthirius multifiliis]EGR27130.1 tubulin-tyrosine ligase family protein, putative [Ichthyophthirius multifiliis]|eukprot:XP_004024014.1 tubulin-tyrosine ligase family protein, putative [Ichthyophthirius multifiliis]
MVKNLKLYCETSKIFLFNITPITFTIDLSDDACVLHLTQFASYFYKLNPNKPKSNTQKLIKELINNLKSIYYSVNSDYKKLKSNFFSKPKMHNSFIDCLQENNYIWLLKPTVYNRGRGIELFNNLDQFQKFIKEYSDGIFDKNLLLQNHINKNNQNNINNNNKSFKSYQLLKSSTFVIQKYIEKPLLIFGRKFDIRIFVFVNYNMDCYIYKCGYIRTASQLFKIGDFQNQFIHLTNNAVQKYAQNYGQFEDGNILSLEQLQSQMNQYPAFDFYGKIWPKIKDICLMTLQSVKKKINSDDRKHCFELFGYDFFIDEDFKVWLIEINSNPCLEESNFYLSQLMPRMIDDMFKISLDQLFTKPNGYANKIQQKFTIDGQNDDENLWQFMINLSLNNNNKQN